MNETELMAKLLPTDKTRVPLYLAPSKIENLYLQTVTAVTELTRSMRDHDKLSGNIFGFLGGEISAEEGLELRIAVNPLLQALVIERAANESKQLIDLAFTPPEQGKVVRYVGPARFIQMNQEIIPDVAGLSRDVATSIARRRKIQEDVLRFRDDKIRTVVLVFQANGVQFAAIASTEFINISSFSSYFTYTEFGVLCRLEGPPIDEVTFLDPIWIWYEGH